mgnify:CR=1 FL=1
MVFPPRTRNRRSSRSLVGPYLIAFHPSRLIRGSDQRLHPHQLHADGLRGFQRKEALLSHTATDKGIVHTAILLILMRDRHVLHIKRPIPVQLRLEAFILYLEDNDHHHDHADRQAVPRIVITLKKGFLSASVELV